MKITTFQLEQHLAKELAPVYIISGEELILKQDALQLIRKTAQNAGFHDRIRITPETSFNWESLYTLLYSTSLLADKQLIEFDLQAHLPDKSGSHILQEYAKNPSTDHTLLIHLGKLEDKISKSAWYKALDKIGISLTLWPIAREQLPQWIMQRAKKYKLVLNQETAHLLATYTEGNLAAAAQAIEKIYLTLEPAQSKSMTSLSLNHDVIKSILVDESHFNLFDFIEQLIAGNAGRAIEILQNLEQEGTEPVIILWGIAREMRLLLEMAQNLQQGQRLDALFQKQRIFSRRQPGIRNFLKRFTVEQCQQSLAHILALDKMVKGAAPFNIWEGLQMYCLRLSRC